MGREKKVTIYGFLKWERLQNLNLAGGRGRDLVDGLLGGLLLEKRGENLG